MAISRGKSGTGITESETLTWTDREDEKDPAVAAILERGTLEGLLTSLERECFAIMASAGLPTTHGSFGYEDDGEWHELSRERDWPKRIANEIWPIASARGYGIDDPIGFAARMLGDIVWARRAFQEGKHDRAALHIFYLGAKWSSRRIKAGWEAAAEAGKKALEGAASTRKGDQAERVAAVDRLLAEGITTKKTAAFAIVAEREGVTAKAIETDYYKAKKKRS